MDQRWRTTSMKLPFSCLRIVLTSIILFLGALFVSSVPAQAQTVPPDAPCIGCHVGGEGIVQLPSGETLSVNVDIEMLVNSVHNFHQDLSSQTAVFCTDCHSPADYIYPHRPLPVDNLADYAHLTSENCQHCHLNLEQHNPGHLIPQIYGLNNNLPTCSDCHGGHNVGPTDQLAADPIGFCLTCHAGFRDEQSAALHEQVVANLGEGQSCRTCHTDNVVTSVNAPSFSSAEQCVTCHTLLEGEAILASGDTIPLHVTAGQLWDSVHGEQLANMPGYRALLCVDCHEQPGYQIFPHPIEIPAESRIYTIERSDVCQKCHVEIYADQMDGIHGHLLAAGNLDAATCVDCHGSHNIQPPDEPRQRISQTCGQCHAAINDVYLQSVHGAALVDGDPNVPTCTDCHGVHGIEDPRTALFRLRSPQICAECHADETLMAQYNISTDVFDTYVADFHGTTVTIFEQTAPHQVPNAAVCTDCHGVHDILPATDENSSILKANLLTTCQQCHPDATENFPDSWMSHFRPSLEHYPFVYLVKLFYDILIPLVIGGFLVFVLSDVYRRLIVRWQDRRKPAHE
jgi:predicted CXXCH cytochrome family protein